MSTQQNPFQTKHYSDEKDAQLLELALKGDRKGLEELLERHQAFIFNVALKMINNVEDSKDVTQEILIKLITNLGKYDATKGKFRTWLYRVTFNHILNLKKQKYEKAVTSFDSFFNYIEQSPIQELTDHEEVEMQVFIEESKVACMAGMLMCLDRNERMIYIIGEVFEIDHNLAGEIFDVTPSAFRKKLSRARKNLQEWMHNRCGLVNKENPCRCPKKTKGFIEKGWVNPENLKWHSNFKHRIAEYSESHIEEALLDIDDIYARLYRDHPFKIMKKSESITDEIINNKSLQALFDLADRN